MTAPKIFLNYATVAPMSEAAYTAHKQFLEEFYTVGPPEVLYTYDPYDSYVSVAAAKLLNADPDEIACTKNTSEGVIIASEALPIAEGDEILIQSCEYPANLLPWLKKRKDGIRVTVVSGPTAPESYRALLAAITPKTKVVALSWAQYADGYMADIGKLSEICQSKGIYVVVDAVQAVGIRAIDVQKTPVDILVCGGQKFLQAGPGAGFMYVNKRTLPQLKDTKVGIRSVEKFDTDGYRLKKTAARFHDGTQNPAGLAALHAALEAINQKGIAQLENAHLEKLTAIKACLDEHGLSYVDHGHLQSNIIALPVTDPRGLQQYLAQRHIFTRAIGDKYLRISFSSDTSLDEINQFARITKERLQSI